MIFVTVGSQIHFDRLVRAMDRWAGENDRDDVLAQIGESEFRPSHIGWKKFLSPEEFRNAYAEARIVVAHAGTGSILTALQLGKPIVIVPRRANLKETRNDHQLATARWFEKFESVSVAWSEAELTVKLSNISELSAHKPIGSHASVELLDAIGTFIEGGEIRPTT